jgi:IclR family transcriptional regulator, acetate operon repressor
MNAGKERIRRRKIPSEDDHRARGRPRAFHDKTDQNTIKSLDRSLGLLTELARMEAATLSELARARGESPATVYRVLITMQAHRIVEFDETLQVWHVGAGAFLIGSTFLRRTGLIERARPVLRQLMEETGETANLGVESEGAVLFVSQVETHATIRAFFPPGTKSPLHASGIGKVLLANAMQHHIAHMLEGYTAYTITEPDRLAAELEAVRVQGYAVDNEERTAGMRCVAAPIRNVYGEVIAGLSVSGPVSRVTRDRIHGLAERVVEAADSVSLALGARQG